MDEKITASILPKRVRNILGVKRGRLTIIRYVGIAKNRAALWEAECDCDRDKTTKKRRVVNGGQFLLGKVKSCGCLKVDGPRAANTKHGMHGTPEYQAWLSARKRTRNPNHPAYKNYGGRGIGMTDELFDSYPLFFSETGFRPTPKHTLDRRDNERGYEPGNLWWRTRKQQANNRRDNKYVDYLGEKLTHSQLADRFKLPRWTVKNRLRLGWSVEEAVSTPVRVKRKSRPCEAGSRESG